MSTSAAIDIVVTTCGRFDCLEKCLNAVYLESLKSPINLIVLDNGSPSDERIVNQRLFEWKKENNNIISFKTKRLPQNTGFPQGANEGARMGNAPLIMFLSDDVELQFGAVEKVLRRMDDPTIGICGIKLIFPPTSTSPIRPAGKVQHVGLSLNIRGEPIHPLVGWSPDNLKTCVSRDVWAVTGACLTIRRSLFNKVGGFDLMYGMGTFEDMSLNMEVRRLGYRIFVDVDALGYHYVGATAEKLQQSFPIPYNLNLFRTKWMQSGLISYGRDAQEGQQLSELDFW
jgi:O-antigen biosynthesis protein